MLGADTGDKRSTSHHPLPWGTLLREPAEPRAVLWGSHLVKVVGVARAAGEMAASEAIAAQN